MFITRRFLNFIQRAYGNEMELKLIASIASLAIASEITYKNRHREILICLTSGLLTYLLIYLCFLPLFLIYLRPVLRKLMQLWFSSFNLFSDNILRLYSKKLHQILPSTWTFELEDKAWPVTSIQFTIKIISLSTVIVFCLNIHSYLVFGTIFNVYITIFIILVVVRTLWIFFDAIDLNLYPFIFIITILHYITPLKSLLYIPTILWITIYLYPRLHRILIGGCIEHFINEIQLMNFRTYLELDNAYKQFSAEIINLFITICLIYRIFFICLTNNLSWTLTISIVSFLSICIYTNLICLISILPNLIMFMFSSIIISEYILYGNFSYRYFPLTIILIFYFIFIYPLLYITFRRSTIKLSNSIGLKLKLIREYIHEKSLQRFHKYNSSEQYPSYSFYITNILYQLLIYIFNIIFRLFHVLFRYR
ncbi:unnamed protein product [Rotaria sp. Silwood1]|nr:unnamed protein product [Rotaria sp. Silwood1]CAF1551686.1 unnamed protein product [Rotaria sp. Silwood1]CAF3641030.1 unnamed protein product [Rotaria sp. Silwood1]CAF3721793.1 unnamed protein product [Rotaria sp. Silwood1]CAF4650700.1 unnamed protein product [Rotaria sp. Silwood1]